MPNNNQSNKLLYQAVAGVGVLVGIVTAVAVPIHYTAKLENRIENLEKAPSNSSNQLEAKTSHLEARINDLASAQSQLAKTIKSLSARDSNGTPVSVDLTEVNTRIKSLETRVKNLQAAPKINSGKIEIKSDYQTKFRTKSLKHFDVSLMGCFRSNSRVNCNFLLNNNTSKDYLDSVKAKSETRAILPSGESLQAFSITIGSVSDNDNLSYNFPSRIPTKVVLSFTDIPDEAKGFLALQFQIYYTGVIEFRNIAFTN